ncbi:MAG TPA: hypothetical protein VG347_10685 [Verrucomicrobiae bacterium]|nr:hypothetical protein [Verrucomicrobiae bacterium]
MKDEYFSIMRIRNLSNPCSDCSSAWKIEVCATPISRAAWARVLPACFLKRLASAVKSFSETDFSFNMQAAYEIKANRLHFYLA